MNINKCKRCCLRCWCQRKKIEHKYIGGKWPVINEAINPSLIEWKNLGLGKINRCMRTTLVWIISAVLIFLGFYVLIWILDYKETHAGQVTQEDCGDNRYTFEEAQEDFFKPLVEQLGVYECFCIQEFRTQLYQVAGIEFENGEKPCVNWLQTFSLNQAVINGLAVSIALLTGILRVVVRELSKIEGKHTVTERLASATRKMWVI